MFICLFPGSRVTTDQRVVILGAISMEVKGKLLFKLYVAELG
jgi:hypothetical protein